LGYIIVYRVGTNSCTFPIKNTQIPEDPVLGLSNTISSTTVWLAVNGQLNKRIAYYSQAYKSSDGLKYSSTLSNQILGYVKSPLDERIAILYAQEDRGYEGPPNVISVKFIGLNGNNLISPGIVNKQRPWQYYQPERSSSCRD